MLSLPYKQMHIVAYFVMMFTVLTAAQCIIYIVGAQSNALHFKFYLKYVDVFDVTKAAYIG